MVEVLSPNESLAAAQEKAREWLSGGATLVWLIDPQRRVVEVWRREGLTQTLGDDDTLSGEEVLPGFAFPVRELWE